MIVHDKPIEEYHGDPESVSKSGLDDIAKSPAKFYALHLDPDRPPSEPPTPAQVIGTLAHCAILEPDSFNHRYPVSPSDDKRTKAWKEFEATLASGQTPIKEAEYAMAHAQRQSVLKIAPLRDALAAGRAEVSAYWTDAETGVACRCRPDWVHPVGENGVILLDVKTCVDASPEGFAKSVANWRYDVQDAFYADGFAAASGKTVHAFIFAAVEKEYPYLAAAYMLTDEDREAGRRKYKRDLRRYAACKKAGDWPGYSAGIEVLALPAWAKRDEE